jgi:hypothetical protein
LSDGTSLFEGFQGKRRPGPCIQMWSGDGFDDYTWDQWRAGADRAAAGLRARGVEKGEPVGCLLNEHLPGHGRRDRCLSRRRRGGLAADSGSGDGD